MKTIKKIRRRNRRIKYNEESYINKNYVVDGKAVIPVELDKTDDLFMKHDFKKYLSTDLVKDIELDDGLISNKIEILSIEKK